MSVALEVRDLSVRFGSRAGLEGVSFSVAGGDRLALVGRSGVGKTSLLRTVSGALPALSGRVLIDDRDVTDETPDRRDCVLLSQRPMLFPHLDVFENVAFPLRVRRVPRPEVAPRVRAALDAVRLSGLEGRAPHELSGGQAHRVALARAVVARPAVLLLDEPLASLDPSLREEVREAVLAVHAEYRPALVMVTHDLAEAGRVATHMGVLLGRGIAQLDTPEGIFRRPASEAVARFLGLPNRVPCRIAPDGLVFPGGIDVAHGRTVAGGSAPGAAAVAIFGADAARIRRPGSTGASGVVEAVHHRPEGVSVRVTMKGLSAPPFALEASLGDDVRVPAAGEPVDVELRGDRMHVFPAPEEEPGGWLG